MTSKPKRHTINVVESSYQPSKAEPEKKIRIKTTPKNLAKVMVQNVKIQHSPDAPK